MQNPYKNVLILTHYVKSKILCVILKNTSILDSEIINVTKSKKQLPKVAFGELVEQGIIPPGAVLTDAKSKFK